MKKLEMKFHSWQEACSTVESVLAEGDLIFLDIPSFLFRRVAASTKSWTSHVGIAFRSDDGSWLVSESTIPFSAAVPLSSYLQGSSRYRFEIKRLNRPLEKSEIERMRSTAKSMLKRFYGLAFNFDSSRLFCSKFVYLVYQSIGVEVGEIQTFKSLLNENPKASLIFWRIWFFGSIPWSQRTVTPANQLNDPKFETVLKGA